MYALSWYCANDANIYNSTDNSLSTETVGLIQTHPLIAADTQCNPLDLS